MTSVFALKLVHNSAAPARFAPVNVTTAGFPVVMADGVAEAREGL